MSGPEERIIWVGPVRHLGGFGEVARTTVRGLETVGAEVRVVDPFGHRMLDGVGRATVEAVERLEARAVPEAGATVVYHAPPGLLAHATDVLPAPTAGRRVACTITETDRIPRAWADALATFDEVWVPTVFHREVFAAGGVPRHLMRLVPYGVDTTFFTPGARPRRRAFRFLYVFQFDWRKGFDLLVSAYLSEFRRREPVELVLKVFDGAEVSAEIARSVADRVDLFRDDLPRVRVLHGPIDPVALRRLHRSADLYVSTDRANGWGVPCHEAMACGRAAATIDWSGSTEFMHEANALLIPPGPLEPVDARLVAARPDYADQCWASVDVEDVRRVLRSAYEDRDRLAQIAEAGATEVHADRGLAAAGLAVTRRDEPRASRPGLLAKVLAGIGGAGAPAIAGPGGDQVPLARGVWAGRLPDAWAAALAAHAASVRADATRPLCLWLDDSSRVPQEVVVDELMRAAAAEGLDLRSEGDVTLTVAPFDHIPWEQVEVVLDDLGPAPVGRVALRGLAGVG